LDIYLRHKDKDSPILDELWALSSSRCLDPTGNSHKPGGRLVLLSARSVVTFSAKEHHWPFI